MKTGFAAFLFIVLIACDQPEHVTTVNGTVINFGSRQPMAGARVTLTDGVGGDWLLPGANTSSSAFSQIYTDSLGKFSISLKGKYQASLSVGMKDCEYDPNWSDGISIGVRGLAPGTHDDVICELRAYAWFNATFQEKPGPTADSLEVNLLWYDILQSGRGPFGQIFTGAGPFRFMSIDKGWIVIGDRFLRYELKVRRNEVWTSTIDSVYIKSFDAFDGVIFY
ncbi:MAG: hypothetical protein WDO15_15125 [Bacteroidota bacterium]